MIDLSLIQIQIQPLSLSFTRRTKFPNYKRKEKKRKKNLLIPKERSFLLQISRDKRICIRFGRVHGRDHVLLERLGGREGGGVIVRTGVKTIRINNGQATCLCSRVHKANESFDRDRGTLPRPRELFHDLFHVPSQAKILPAILLLPPPPPLHLLQRQLLTRVFENKHGARRVTT